MISAVDDLVVEALFVSHLQPSQTPTADAIEAAVTQTILRFGSGGCAAAVATEFGDHPEIAVPRMCWVRRTLTAIAALPETETARAN